ncbi:MAG TPA: TetR family transcriptional regulator [Streptosporangiaceae bacterium]|jgi:AcrR family transcriptional regulator
MARTDSAERARLSREAVVDGALALAGADGMDALTIRRLAQHLGVTPMALYWHFKNKDELLAGMADRLWSLVDSAVDPGLSWPDQLRSLMGSLVTVLRAHPAITPLLMSIEAEEMQSCFRTMEAAMAVLDQAGFSPRQSADLCTHGLRTAVGLVTGERDATDTLDPDLEAHRRRKRIVLESLPLDRYPHVIAGAQALTSCDDPDAYYDFGIELFIAGVVALAARS